MVFQERTKKEVIRGVSGCFWKFSKAFQWVLDAFKIDFGDFKGVSMGFRNFSMHFKGTKIPREPPEIPVVPFNTA